MIWTVVEYVVVQFLQKKTCVVTQICWVLLAFISQILFGVRGI